MDRARPTLRRLAALALVGAAIAGAVVARRSGVDAAAVQRALADLGLLGPPLFVALFAAGELVHLPGIVFVVVARVAFGPALGLALGYAGALVAVTVSFAAARFVVSAARATREPWRPRAKLLRRALAGIERRPVLTVAALRLVLWFAPPLTYAIAATNIRARDHALGSALGLLLPVAAASVAGGML